MTTYIGIDPGHDGALCANIRGKLSFRSMPTQKLKGKNKREIDERELTSWICDCLVPAKEVLVIIEKVQAYPGQGVVSMFNFGVGWGLVRGVCAGLDLPYQLVRPQEWQKGMMAGQAKGSEFFVASRLWPEVNWKKSNPTKKQLEGIVDAALIAEWGRRAYCGSCLNGRLREAKMNWRERGE